jgi:hypothetical protein
MNKTLVKLGMISETANSRATEVICELNKQLEAFGFDCAVIGEQYASLIPQSRGGCNDPEPIHCVAPYSLRFMDSLSSDEDVVCFRRWWWRQVGKGNFEVNSNAKAIISKMLEDGNFGFTPNNDIILVDMEGYEDWKNEVKTLIKDASDRIGGIFESAKRVAIATILGTEVKDFTEELKRI